MSWLRSLAWALLVGILGAWLYDKWIAYRTRRVIEGDTGSFVAEVQRFFLTPVTGGPPGVASTAAGSASDKGGCGCRG